uniref:Uncharacterized protein n=1 Tax=Ditylenchus dipsaci TaxID=166011 RepID=A0A915EG24_9BILA
MPTMLCTPPKLDLPTISSDEIEQIWSQRSCCLFKTLDWTLEELKYISLWHAQADYQKCVVLVERKLANSHI